MKNLTRLLIFTIIVVTIMLAISGWAWLQIPVGQQLPVHFNAAGEVDRYGGKFEALLLLPLLTVGIMGLMTLVTRIEPRQQNLLQSYKAFTGFWVILVFFFLGLHIVLTLIALGYPLNIGQIMPIGLGILFIVLGNYMGKIRSTYTFGIRTPWTLDSELAWNKTHRLGGKLFMLAGLAVLISALFAPGPLSFIVLMVGIFGTVIVSTIYSYLIWRSDPQVLARKASE